MKHLTPADYTAMPWANGRGTTTELIRVNHADGRLLWRLSMAAVVDDGAFSVFPGVERNLTVISGPGFDLVGARTLRADSLVPVAFPGDVAMAAAGVVAPSADFNVMTCRSLARPVVRVLEAGKVAPPPGGTLCLFALAPALAGGQGLARHDLLICHRALAVSGGPVIAVGLAEFSV
ncbi:MAG: HutD family protein [Pseudorhodobacter sp.]|nr:HutD family protein [Pseudorhodobacter sp.]